MGFLQKVEAKTSRLVHKPTKPTKPVTFTPTKAAKKPAKPNKSTKPTKPVKFETSSKSNFLTKARESKAEKQKKPGQVTFMRLKQLLPEFEKILTLANPFDLNDITWARFFALAAPKVMTALLWDLGHINRAQRANMIRYFKQRVKLP